MATPNPTNPRRNAPTPRAGRSISSVVSRRPVRKSEDAGVFFIIGVLDPIQLDLSEAWRLVCRPFDPETGTVYDGLSDEFVILQARNAVRDSDLSAMQQALAVDPAPFGPVTLAKLVLPNRPVGRDTTWEIRDYDPAAAATAPANVPDA